MPSPGPLYRANSSTSTNSAVTSRSCPLPSAGLFLGGIYIAVVFTYNNDNHTTATTGWNKIGSTVNSGGSFCASIFWANQGAGQPTFSWTNASAVGAVIGLYTDPSGVLPLLGQVSVSTGSTTPHTSTGITTTADSSLVTLWDVSAANTALATPAGWTSDVSIGNGTPALHIDEKSMQIATAGSSSGNTSAAGANAAWVAWQVELARKNAGFTTYLATTKLRGQAIEGAGLRTAITTTKLRGQVIEGTNQTFVTTTKLRGQLIEGTKQNSLVTSKLMCYVILAPTPLKKVPSVLPHPLAWPEEERDILVGRRFAPPPIVIPPYRFKQPPYELKWPDEEFLPPRRLVTLAIRVPCVIIHPVDPRFMTFDHWSAIMAASLSMLGHVPTTLPEDQWQEWAAEVKNIPQMQALFIPDPSLFNSWQAWVQRFNEALWFNCFEVGNLAVTPV